MAIAARLALAAVLFAPGAARAADAGPTAPGIAADLERVRAFLASAVPHAIVDTRTGRPITDLSHPIREAAADRGGDADINVLDYSLGVVHAGMLRAAAATGDRRFSDFTASQLQFFAEALPYFRAQAALHGTGENSFRPILAPAALDDCGAMTAALIKARMAGVGPDLGGVIASWSEYIRRGQFRLPDGTLARHRPQPVSLWTDDLYMGVPALVQMGRMTGDRRCFDDAVRNTLLLSQRLFQPAAGLYDHGWNADDPDAPPLYWARANGWAMMAMCELLDVLPQAYPGRDRVLGLLRAQIRAVASLQSGQGLWHQMLDREDSYLETSASAMFVYGIAHAIDQGWINPVSYGPVAQAGWLAVAGRIDSRGRVQGICAATTFASIEAYYYDRPVSVYAMQGYGPVLLAGSEMIRMLGNPALEIRYDHQTVHYYRRSAP
jgi:unsaturated rhamnogalacturonyl hydrolase